ncbi:phage major capsid protein [Streptococcus parauberis]|uniref:phage major capsid protein n=1 Tax=Streptococcus parauberis TaxID=1348 RepID=UPI000789B0F7|nr:phage major capsid protein [Streptococcus parauberis]QBX18157.1 capsid protein [Streptococcus phage Javan399]KYP20785.1 Phage capsid family protein [Streptococcus parauberis]KYP21169.1 Phage capsid family protein [Streptococcus parauberis]KYP22435.1 Phage capsid family protein [Streptococcus parauberis]KYP24828.1 Phage capsid family protein [Streptococcus parauberis]
MNKTVNELNVLWTQAGEKVETLNDKISNALADETMTAEQFKDLKDQRDNAKAIRDGYADQMAELQAVEVVKSEKKPLNKDEQDVKTTFIKDFKNLIAGKYQNATTSTTGDVAGNGGLTIPQDIQTAIHTLVRQYDSLQEYVNVEKVSTLSGSRVFEKLADITPLAELDEEGAVIGNLDDPQLSVVKYLIKRYAGISTVTNSLLKDTAENIMAWLSSWIAKKVVVTRNAKIIAQLSALPKKPTLAKWDDIKDMVGSLDPALQTTSIFLTNQSGFTALSKVKNAIGEYLMEDDVKSPTGKSIEGYAVKVVADKWLPKAGSAMPLYFGDLKQAITLFDRENMELLATNIGGGAFETDTNKVRVIDRFDVQPTDTDAVLAGSFTAIANQDGQITTVAGA